MNTGAARIPHDRSIISKALALAFSAAALMAAVFIGVASLGASGLPPGCGAGDGCGEVLGSVWARWYGFSVAWGAVALYAALIVALLMNQRHATGFFAAAAITGIAWFILLQAAVLRAFCLYCMIDHGLGLVAACSALIWARPGKKAWLAGLAFALLFVGLQIAQPRRIHQLRAPGEGDADFIDERGQRVIALLEGTLLLDVTASPRIGRPDAKQLVAVMVDYACPQCRDLHHDLVDYQKAHPDRLAVLVVPVPVNPACNPLIDHTHERFAESCELVALSLGIFHLRPEAWVDFDLWLFDLNRPRLLEEARDHVRDQFGLDPDTAQNLPQARHDLERNVAAFGALPVEDPRELRVPVLLAAGHAPVIGPAGRIDQLPHLTPMTAKPESPE